MDDIQIKNFTSSKNIIKTMRMSTTKKENIFPIHITKDIYSEDIFIFYKVIRETT